MANMTKRASLVGKGDRPRKVDQKKFADSYDKIFAKDKKDADRKL
jgi:hypothetical protein